MDETLINTPEQNNSKEDKPKLWKRFTSSFKNMSSIRQILLWYLIISLSGALLLFLPFSHSTEFNELNGDFGLPFIDSLFISSSAFSDTGLSTYSISDTFNWFGQFVTLVLLQVGGVGWFTIRIFVITYILRMKTNYDAVANTSSELGTANKNETLGLVFVAIIISISASFIGGFIFSLIFQFTPVEGIDNYWQALWTGIYHSSASINNSGLDIFQGNDSMATLYGATPGSEYIGYIVTIQLMTLFLFILGGVGFGVIYDFTKYIKSKKTGERFQFSVVTKLSFFIYFAVAFIGLGLTFLSEGLTVLGDNPNAFLSSHWVGASEGIKSNTVLSIDSIKSIDTQDVLINTYDAASADVDTTFVGTSVGYRCWVLTFNTFSTRNAGFASMNLAYLHDTTKFIYSLMMFIGSGPGSTAGGLRTTTFGVLVVSLWATMRNKPQAHAFGKGISSETTRLASSILLMSLILVSIDVVCISTIETAIGETNHTFIDNMFVVFSAYGTTGLAIADLESYHWISKLLLILLMFIGQMGISNTMNQIKTKQIKHQKTYLEEPVNLG